MNNAYISALAALAGSGIGALAAVGTTWLTHHHQDRSQRLTQIRARLEQLFAEFIDQASRVFADALIHQLTIWHNWFLCMPRWENCGFMLLTKRYSALTV